jgi:hypothetical protein
LRFRILTLSDSDEWDILLRKIPDCKKSPHFNSSYYKLFEERGEGKSICFVGELEEKLIVYPTLLKSISKLGYDLGEEFYDLEGVYGYNGPVTNCENVEFISEFGDNLLKGMGDLNIVSEFVRFCPVIKNEHLLSYITPLHALDNVLLDLSKGYTEVWEKSYDPGVRKAIRKAERFNYSFKIIDGINIILQDVEDFVSIYNSTMSRNHASTYYYFSEIFFKNLIDYQPESILLSFAILDGKPVSTEILLINNHHAYGFLGGTLKDYFNYNPNSILRNQIVKYLTDQGICQYSLGGGKSNEDSIYSYKKSFSRYIKSDFFIGKKIHNKGIYDELFDQWIRKYPENYTIGKNYLLKYRLIRQELIYA